MLNESLKKRIQKLAGIYIKEQFDGGKVDTYGLPKSETETLAYNLEQCELPTHAKGDGMGFVGHRLA